MTSLELCPVPLGPLHELNGRCLDLLAHAARTRPAGPGSRRDLLHEALGHTTADSRRRAAARHFLLFDLEFRNIPWWQAIARASNPGRGGPAPHSLFPPRSAIPLARATLTVAWQAVHFQLDTACLLLGMDPAVARLLVDLPVTTLDRMANRVHRCLQPRWSDRLAFWRDLIEAAERNDRAQLRALDAQGLQLLTGDLLSDAHSRHLT